MNKKIINKLIFSVVVIALLLTAGFFANKYYGTTKDNLKEHYVLTGVITNVESGRVLVKNNSDSGYYSIVIDSKDYKIGDEIVVYTKEAIKDNYPSEIVASRITKIEEEKKDETVKQEVDVTPPANNASSSNSSNNNSSNSNSSSSSNSGSSSNTNKNNSSSSSSSNSNSAQVNNYGLDATGKGTEKDVVNYFSTLNSVLDKNDGTESFGKTVKKGFVTVVDFMFYGGSIKGVTFSQLSASAKTQVLKIAGWIDEKIDRIFPGYKATLSSKYQGIKTKIVTTYLDWATKVCNDEDAKVFNKANCETAKKGFQDLKSSFGLTWDFIKSITNVGLTKLSEWYLIWSADVR